MSTCKQSDSIQLSEESKFSGASYIMTVQSQTLGQMAEVPF